MDAKISLRIKTKFEVLLFAAEPQTPNFNSVLSFILERELTNKQAIRRDIFIMS